MKILNKFKVPAHIVLLIRIYILSLSFFFIFRLLLFIMQADRLENTPGVYVNILKAFIIGIRFDLVITGYIMLPSFLLLAIVFLINIQKRIVYRFLFFLIFILYVPVFMICAADIPYYDQFASRFSVDAFQWMDNPGYVAGMIFQEPRYYVFIIPFILLSVLFFILLNKFFHKLRLPKFSSKDSRNAVPLTLLFFILIFIGIRGHVEAKKPVNLQTAEFCDNSFLNQLGLNPVFTLIKSIIDSKDESLRAISYMDEFAAITKTQIYLHISDPLAGSPIARNIIPDSVSEQKFNVVLIMMESMAAANLQRNGNNKQVTPFLDSISHHALYFENIYSAGIHTHNGIVGTLCSFPSLYKQHLMQKENALQYNGIANTLKNIGYSTSFFTTHGGAFDNTENFLSLNGFDNFFSQADYPEKEVKTIWGVPDDFLFRFAIPKLDSLDGLNRPFFTTLLTGSNHGPFYIPDYFSPRYRKIKDAIVEYADWSIRQFMHDARKKEWFNNTLFVLVADHGLPLYGKYDIELDYFHIPLIIYAPGIIKESQSLPCMGGQIDIFPTIMGLLKLPYLNNTLGIDLLNEERPYIFMSNDNTIGVIGNRYLLIRKSNQATRLYRYIDEDKRDYIQEEPQQAKEMEEYMKANLQVFQDMLIQHNTYYETPYISHKKE